MSVPPQGGWQPGPIPPNQGQPYGQPFDPSAYNPQQQPPPPGWQQGSWAHPPGPPPPKGGGLKWLLIAVAVLLVVAVSIGATLLFTREGGGGGSTPTSGAPSDIASANDTGPVSIITEEPTCSSATAINNSLATSQSNGWPDERFALGPASAWTPDQRAQVDTVAKTMRGAADQAVTLAKQTPHRVVREVYEQFIAYSRAYADSVANYLPIDNALATASVSASSALVGICNAIEDGSASRSLTLDPAPSPTTPTNPTDPAKPEPFIASSDGGCDGWVARLDRFNAESSTEWQQRDASIPGSQWSAERREVERTARALLSAYAEDIEAEGQKSGNPILEDFALTSALYIRAYVAIGDNYTVADGWLPYTGFRIANLVSAGCLAVNG